jgi:2-dehydropantoate 2-reductase
MIFNKVCIVGAGAIGGWLGAGLARAGCSVSFLARGETLKVLQTQGLTLQSGTTEEVHAVRASDNAAALGAQDLVIIAVKAPALREVAQQIGPLLGKSTVVLTAERCAMVVFAGVWWEFG